MKKNDSSVGWFFVIASIVMFLLLLLGTFSYFDNIDVRDAKMIVFAENIEDPYIKCLYLNKVLDTYTKCTPDSFELYYDSLNEDKE